MTTHNKLAIAISLASGMMMASQAQAFDNVDWDWDGQVDTNVEIEVYIDPGITDPGGLVMVESLQEQIGDVSSEAIVSDVSYGAASVGTPSIDLLDSTSSSSFAISGSHSGSHGASASAAAAAEASANVDVYVSYAGSTPNPDITKLESLENAATSVGNNISVDSDAMVNLHNEQFLAGSDGHFFSPGTADIESLAMVDNLLNLSVDNAATSVGNNLSVTLDAAGIDSVLIADNTQMSFANISSSAQVSNITLDLPPAGSFSGPVVSNAATSVGNNMSISVGTQTTP